MQILVTIVSVYISDCLHNYVQHLFSALPEACLVLANLYMYVVKDAIET